MQKIVGHKTNLNILLTLSAYIFTHSEFIKLLRH